MKRLKYILPFFISLFVFSSCQDYVTDVDPWVDRVTDDALNNESQIDFLLVGLENRLNWTMDNTFLIADGLSDALFFDRIIVPTGTYQTYDEIELADIRDDNYEILANYNLIQEYRMNADTMINRVMNKMTFTNEQKKKDALYFGYFHSAFSRYLLASYYGRGKTTGGATINISPFITSNNLYNDAINRFKEALKNTTSVIKIRLVNSLIARIYLFVGDYSNAAQYVNIGMAKGDSPFIAKYNTENDNLFRSEAGELRCQWGVAQRFVDYVTADPTEANRIKYKKVNTYYQQTKYIRNSDGSINPIDLMTWQENNLMKAELNLRGQATGNALALVNEVRTSRNVSQLASIDLAGMIIERDKELYLRGSRLIDQRRFGKFHVADGWQYLPLPREEYQKNPNL